MISQYTEIKHLHLNDIATSNEWTYPVSAAESRQNYFLSKNLREYFWKKSEDGRLSHTTLQFKCVRSSTLKKYLTMHIMMCN